MKATLVKRLSGFTGTAALYRMKPPLNKQTYVVVSATVAMGTGPEVLIFPATKAGEVKNWGEVAGQRGTLDHREVLENLGYRVEP